MTRLTSICPSTQSTVDDRFVDDAAPASDVGHNPRTAAQSLGRRVLLTDSVVSLESLVTRCLQSRTPAGGWLDATELAATVVGNGVANRGGPAWRVHRAA